MNGKLTIEGDLATLGRLALKINEWFPNELKTHVSVPSWGGWNVEAMTVLLRRLAPKQLQLLDFVSAGDGYQSDEAVRRQFGNETGGMKGLTGPISKHIKAMAATGDITESAVPVVKTEPNPGNRSQAGGFRIPGELVPIVRAALRSL